MNLIAVGVDHTTAELALRERCAFAHAEIPAALRQLTDPVDGLLSQAAILSTCNRVELYGVGTRVDERRLAAFMGLGPGEVDGALYVHRDEHVAHHLAATAAGLHSLVLGEVQIQGQIRLALDQALAAGTAGPELRRLFESAVAAGRRVRARTAIGRGAASVPSACVEFAHRRIGGLERATVLLIGTGVMGQLAARLVVKRGARELLVVSRTRVAAQRLAQRHGGHALAFDQLDDALARADVVFSATGAPHPILGRDQLERAGALLLIDLAVPRDVDPAARELPGVELHTIDDLRGLVDRALARRQAELPQAHAILESEVQRYVTWAQRRRPPRRAAPAHLCVPTRADVGG
jgi:glutamyl-tRNA reductase